MHPVWSVVALVSFTLSVGACSSSTSSPAASHVCAPGASIACAGTGGCAGNQVCKADGSGYDPCACGGGGGGDAGVGVDASATPDAGDSGTVGDAQPAGDGAAWSPAMLPGLSVWLDDTVGVIADPQVAGGVARWLDQSGNMNTANPVNTQGAAGSNFTIDPAVINGHDAIVCPGNGTWLDIADGPTVQFGTGDFGIVTVAKVSGAAGVYTKIDTNGGGAGVFFGTASTNYSLALPGGTVVLAQQNPGNFHIVAGRGATLRLAADGFSATGATNTMDASFMGGAVHIGFLQGGSAEIAELIVVKGTLSDADLAKTTSYLSAKFKL